MTRKLPPLFVEQVYLGEKTLPVPQEDLDALARSDAELRALLPPLRRRRPRLALGAAGLAAAAVVLLSLAPDPPPPAAPVLEETRIKGDPLLLAWTPAHERLNDGVALPPGEVLQLQYVSAGWTEGAILSVDGAGAVTQHLPEAGDRSVALDAKGLAPSAFQLDAAPRYERFYFVASDRPFALGPLIEDLRDGQLDQAPRGAVSRLEIRKEAP